MDRDSLPITLSGGFVEEYSWNLLEKTFTLRVDVLDGGVLSSYRLQFLAVSSVAYHDEPTRKWERLEVTDIRLEEAPEESPTEEWKVWINLWDCAEWTMRCAAIKVDDELLS